MVQKFMESSPAQNNTVNSPSSALAQFVARKFRPYLHELIAEEISTLTRYYDQVIMLRSPGGGEANLLALVDCPVKREAATVENLPDLRTEINARTLVLLSGNLNHQLDAQGFLTSLRGKLSRSSRVGAVIYNSYYRTLYYWANRLGLRKGELPTTFLTQNSIRNIASLSGFELVRARPMAYCPFALLGFGRLLNRVLSALPVLRWLGFAEFVVFRPIQPSPTLPSLSIVIPARNERGNIEPALKRMPDFGGADLEIIFVEGNSTDGTWEEIQRVVAAYGEKYRLKVLKQAGKGKGDAVRLGLAHATGDLLTILDADLTMPPELLPRFYDAYVEGKGDFVNGNRLVYPMEGEAMRFLNWLGNIFFAKSLSWVLDTELGDSLCGTKLCSRRDYERFTAWRKDFGDFDPFGDFELLFPAAILGLGIADIPIRYLARTYGSTQIRRFQHGWMLLKMTWTGLFRIRMR